MHVPERRLSTHRAVAHAGSIAAVVTVSAHRSLDVGIYLEESVHPVLRAQRYIPQAAPIASTMKALQVSRARLSEDKSSFVRWAFPGLFLQEKGVWARRCRACLAARYQQSGTLCAQIQTSF